MRSEESGANSDNAISIEEAIIDKVTSIQGHTELLLERHAKDPQSLKWLSSISKSAEELTKLVYQLIQLRQEREQK